jgi:hypothetical protein
MSKKKRMITLYLEESGGSDLLHVREHVDMSLRESLGLLEWAKAIMIKAVETQNAIESYAEEEL